MNKMHKEERLVSVRIRRSHYRFLRVRLERLFGDIAFALCLNIAYSFFDARRESHPFSSVGSVT